MHAYALIDTHARAHTGTHTNARTQWVPQMADGAEVLSRVFAPGGVASRFPLASFPALVPNARGLERALAAGAREVAVLASASEAFSCANANCGAEEALRRCEGVVRDATAAGARARGYVSCALGCPYEGDVPPERAADAARRLLDIGCYEVRSRAHVQLRMSRTHQQKCTHRHAYEQRAQTHMCTFPRTH